LQPGDILVEINGAVTQGLTLPEAVSRIRGEAGTSVQLKALRPSTQETREYSITRIDITDGSGQPGQPDSSPVPTTLSPPSDSGTPF
jgi:C-terminal processing protease CtpA/Prc